VALQQSPLKNSIHSIVVGFGTICSGQPCSLFTRIGSGFSGALILGEACKQVKKTNYYNKKYIKESIIILAGY